MKINYIVLEKISDYECCSYKSPELIELPESAIIIGMTIKKVKLEYTGNNYTARIYYLHDKNDETRKRKSISIADAFTDITGWKIICSAKSKLDMFFLLERE